MKGAIVTSLGIASNLGGVVTAAAAQRAGVLRRSQLRDYAVFDLGPEMEAPVTGAPIAGFTDGFMAPGLWLRLAMACIEDLIAYGMVQPPDELAFWRRTGLIWVLPEIADERFHWEGADVVATLDRTCMKPLLELTGLPILSRDARCLAGGPAATAIAALHSLDALAKGALDRMLILAADSWLDPLSMRMLLGQDRIKSVEQPVGLCPGEACAAILLESPEAAGSRGAQGQARVLAATTHPALAWPADEELAKSRMFAAAELGNQLAVTIRRALKEGGAPDPFAGNIVIDINGEEWRSKVWGLAQPQLIEVIDFSRSTVVVPAIQFGDIGAASSALGVCLGTRAFVRGYWRPDYSLVCAISESGALAAILLGAAGTPRRQ